MGNFLVWVVWFTAAFACLGSGLAVISFTNPFFSALALIGNLSSLAVLYLLLSAEFVAAAQVLVYAGAVMVMFLFVIAYLGRRAESPWQSGPSVSTLAATAAAGALLVEVIVVLSLAAGDGLKSEANIPRLREPGQIGQVFLTDHLLAFEITSIVLLAAAVGGVVLGSEARPHARRTRRVMGPEIIWYVAVSGGALLDRRARRAAPPQPADHPALARDHAERRQPRPDRVRAARGRHLGQIFALTVMAVAASEVVVGLGLIVAMSRDRTRPRRRQAQQAPRMTS